MFIEETAAYQIWQTSLGLECTDLYVNQIVGALLGESTTLPRHSNRSGRRRWMAKYRGRTGREW